MWMLEIEYICPKSGTLNFMVASKYAAIPKGVRIISVKSVKY